MDSNQTKIYLKDTNDDVIFIFKNNDQMIVKAISRNNPTVFYQNILDISKFPPPFKNKYTTLKDFYNDMEFTGESKLSLKINDKQAALSIKLNDKMSIPITLPLLDSIETPNPKGKIIFKSYDNKQLRNLQQQQKQLDAMIQQLQGQINILKLTETKKDQELQKLQTQKTNVEQHLSQTNKKFQQTKKKFVTNEIDFDQKYGKHIDESNGKHRLFMKQKGVTDQMIKQIVVFDLRKIQVLSFGDNKITDVGFNLLFTDRKWPVLIELFLRNFILIKKKTTKSKISIHLKVYKPYRHFLYIKMNYHKKVATTSANIHWFEQRVFVYHVRDCQQYKVKKGINNECWKKLLEKLKNNFPSLKELWYSNEDDLSAIMKKKILDYCNGNNLSLNHSSLEVGGGNGLEELIKIKLLADLLGGGVKIDRK